MYSLLGKPNKFNFLKFSWYWKPLLTESCLQSLFSCIGELMTEVDYKMFTRTEARKSKKRKKRRQSPGPGLDDNTLNFLCKHTRFSPEEILDWHRWESYYLYYSLLNKLYRVFLADCPDGKLYKSKVIQMYAMIVSPKHASVLVEHIFRVFDSDSNGYVDFKVRRFKMSVYDPCLIDDFAGVYNSNRHDKLWYLSGEAEVGFQNVWWGWIRWFWCWNVENFFSFFNFIDLLHN